MNTRLQFLKAAVQSVAAGFAAGLVANALWLTSTGHTPSLLVSLLAADAVTALYGAAQAIRFRRKWQAVLFSYNQPALGEGIEIPHRPLVDEQHDGGDE
ncbi:hypothetical protein AQI95_24890 [Streptomyces yokosukanensis]|uniref:Uncharacterized protein n=1 Tax=Streptomyces yokosukanensis TaxID=67386 RepID=A0A101P0Q4_9ACTN|nr:hypothetical protein [Streptomyces yokosukanensis]KUN02780.1 hypothetical protein AQI95_24890 [Streptomyces yokosukanensis]